MGANSSVSLGAPQNLMNPSNLSTNKVHRMTLRQKQEEKPKLDLKETIDGLCGPENGDTICGDWPGGSCCSAYGSGECESGNLFEILSPNTHAPDTIHGTFKVVGQSGVPAMSAALLANGRVVFIDKVENYTQLILDNGQYAYSSEYDPSTNMAAPLRYETNAFCSGGAFLEDGRLISIGGNSPLPMDPTVGDGFRALRYLTRPLDTKAWDGKSWDEPGNKLSTNRWYASAQTLRDGTVFVVSGSLNGLNPSVIANNNPTYELLNKDGIPFGHSVLFPILEENQPYYMYPFLHLLKDGTVFVFVARSAEIFDAHGQKTVKKLPDLPGDYRSYPNTGGSVLLPLRAANGWDDEIIICGGGAFVGIASPTDPSCGRIKPLSKDPQWELELMPDGRVMVEGMMLPDGKLIWLNGCNRGAQGFGIAKDPSLDAWIYDPEAPLGRRWSIGGKTEIARMYHSVALVLLDGTVMIAGSNPVEQPILVPNPDVAEQAFATEFRVEIYTPHYLLDGRDKFRPYDVELPNKHLLVDSEPFTVDFKLHTEPNDLRVVLYHGGFVTHSLHMGHRMLYLDHVGYQPQSKSQTILVTMPPDNNIAPPGPYVVYVVADGVPSIGVFVMVEAKR
ncbi:glyoxal oxidase [Histoplasma capsulatum H143]|uniref:Glyoxal oxidase n=1 Tax=Ajellomyces capsulatus (strain H143) TaxID=544712 RepID=C6H409_AJECH|nr:glyoxal oxidase [Histoplasma capsulatum H143]